MLIGLAVLLALAGVWQTAQAGALLQTMTLNPGASLTVSCSTVLSVKMASDKKSLTVSCAAASPTPKPSATATKVSPTKTVTKVAPTATRTRRPTRTPTMAPPTATRTPVPQQPTATPTQPSQPTATPGAGGDTFPAVNSLILGSCSAAVHDRYATTGPDGKMYRTWHPITAPVDANNPNGAKCTFAHEHGDAPHPNMPAPPFGYVAAVHGMFSEIAAHAGFKVYTHYANGNSGLGTPETDYRGLPIDFTLVIHQGSAGAGRLTIRDHSFEFWSSYQGRVTHIHAMADTGLAYDKAFGGGSDARDRFIVSHDAHTYETWGFAVNVGGAWNSGGMFAAVTNPMNHAHGPIESCHDNVCDGVTLISTSEEICGPNFVPCDVRLPFGQHANGQENMWLGNFRTIHEPDWSWTNAGGQEFFCTDAMGMRMACGSNTVLQQVATVNLSNAAASQLLRTPNESGWDPVYWLPLGAPGGN
jgi:hypothetical protein